MESSSKPVKAKIPGATRSRTGCQTCRGRKLKCDEQKPTCGQCAKSNRECVRSDPITFRHHQNSSFGKDGQEHALDSFFKYSKQYSVENLKSFLPIPQQLTWIQVSDQDAEDGDGDTTTSTAQMPSGSNSYQQVAAHTLEALSTAAVDHTTFPPQGTAYYTAVNPQTETHPEYGFVQAQPADATATDGTASTNPHSATNATSLRQTDTSLIDPNLESSAGNGEAMAHTQDINSSNEAIDTPQVHDQGIADLEDQVAMALRSYNEMPV